MSSPLAGPFEPEFGFTAVHELLGGPARPTALVAANHEATPAALQELGRRGVAIPHELSVVAIEDADVLRYWHPAITVIDTDPEQVGELALAALLARLRGEPDPAGNEPTVVEVRLIERASTAAVPLRTGSPRRRDPANSRLLDWTASSALPRSYGCLVVSSCSSDQERAGVESRRTACACQSQ